jgi:hypothetical protein
MTASFVYPFLAKRISELGARVNNPSSASRLYISIMQRGSLKNNSGKTNSNKMLQKVSLGLKVFIWKIGDRHQFVEIR